MNAIQKEATVIEILGMSCMSVDGKKAIVKGWSTKTTQELHQMLKKKHNIAIRTGQPSQCLVVDIDTKNRGLEIWEGLEKKMGKVDTYRVRTGTGGLHLYFDYKGTESIGNKVECVRYDGERVGIDIRNDGGYVVAAPSIHPDTNEPYSAEVSLFDWHKTRQDQTNFPPLPDWLRSLIVGDAELDSDFNIIAREKQEEARPRELNDELIAIGVDEPYIEALLMNCLKADRASNYQDWWSILRALNHTAMQYGLDLKPLAHKFSQRCGAKYDKIGVDTEFNAPTPKGKKPLTLGTIRYMAKEDNPELYEKLSSAITYSNEDADSNWQDLPKIRSSKPTLSKLMSWYRSCIYEVVGQTTTFFAKMRDGKISVIKQPFVARGEDFNIELSPEGTISMRKAFECLMCSKQWLTNTYDRIGYMPSFTEIPKEPGVLNLFTGFPCQPIECTADDEDVKILMFHFREILCSGNKEFFDFAWGWFAHLVQRCGVKIGVVLLFTGKQGTGKNILFDWLGPALFGDEKYNEVDNVDALFDRFNSDHENTHLCLLNEVGTYGKDHKANGRLKSTITRKKQKIEHKGLNKYQVDDACNYLACSNNNYAMKIEESDRRTAVNRVSSARIGDKEYFDRLLEVQTKETAGKLLYLLLNYDLSKFRVQDIPMTEQRAEMMAMSRPKAIRFLLELADRQIDLIDEDDTIKVHAKNLHEHFTVWLKDNGETPMPQRAFSMEIKIELGLVAKNVRIEDEQRKGYEFTLAWLRKILKDYLRTDIKFSD